MPDRMPEGWRPRWETYAVVNCPDCKYSWQLQTTVDQPHDEPLNAASLKLLAEMARPRLRAANTSWAVRRGESCPACGKHNAIKSPAPREP